MSGVLVSVVVSTRDRSTLLGGAIESLLAQQPGDIRYEVVVVDNRSSDDTATVVQQFERHSHGLVRYVLERREGVSNGRNAGIKASRGSIVAFTDDDVRVTPRWLSTAARLLARNPRTQYVGGPVLPVFLAEPPRWLTRDLWGAIAAADHDGTAFEVPTARAVCLITANLFIRRAALDRVGWFHPAFRRCQDHELMLRLWAGGLVGLYDPGLVAETLVPAERLTRGYHRRWHQTRGQFMARMPLRERMTEQRVVVEPSTRGRFVLGAPLFEFRTLLEQLGDWARCCACCRGDEAFSHELRVRCSLAFILTSMRLRAAARAQGAPAERRSPVPIDRRDTRGNDLSAVTGFVEAPEHSACADASG